MYTYFKSIFFTLYYWVIVKSLRYIREYFYYQKKKNANLQKGKVNDFDIYVIAFNNPDVIELQILKLKENLLDDFCLVIFDNSDNLVTRSLIRDVCLNLQVKYINMPRAPKGFLLSESHGLALNWIFKNYIQKLKPVHFGFLDHDIFLLDKISILNKLYKQEFYGVRHFAAQKIVQNIFDSSEISSWYLWPGFCFFKYSFISKFKDVTFMPCCINGLLFDTGGKLYFDIFKSVSLINVQFPTAKRVIGYSGGHIDIIDDIWVHTLSGSNWRKINLPEKYEEKSIEYVLKGRFN